MILYRYIAREVLFTSLAVGSVLLLVIVGSRFARLLGRAASGRISLDILGQLTLLYMPYALQLILPISFMLALMLTFGRLYMESEMPVIQSSGVGQWQLLKLVLVLALLVTGLTAVSTLYITPKTQLASALLLREQQERTGFEAIPTGQFTRLGDQAVYVDAVSPDRQTLERVLIAQSESGQDILAVARIGYQQVSEATQSRFLVLEQGQRYALPGVDLTADVLQFERYVARVGVYTPPTVAEQVLTLSTPALLASDALQSRVELQWRLGLPLMVLVMVLIALPLTRVNPRQGRFVTILPVLLLQLLFLGALMSAQGFINKGQWPLWPGLWAIHLAFLLLGLLICWRRGVFVR